MKAEFSFNYGEKEYTFAVENGKVYELEKGVTVTAAAKEYKEYDALEWVLYFENTSGKDSKIFSKISDSNILLPLATTNPPKRIHISDENDVSVFSMIGSQRWEDYECSNEITSREFNFEQHFLDKERPCFSNIGGRSSNGTMPFFDITANKSGYIAAIGWTGDWKAEFNKNEKGVQMISGLKETNFYLKSGEKIRTSSTLIMSYTKSEDKHNKFRKLIKNHFSHKSNTKTTCDGLMAFELWGSQSDSEMEKRINELTKHGIKFEEIWIDAGWFGNGDISGNTIESDWTNHVGDWNVNINIHPDNLKTVSKCVQDNGMRLMLWFEPERAMEGTEIVKNHPEWFLKLPNTKERILNYGNKEALGYIFKLISNYIKDLNLLCYRQDFNTDLTSFFKVNDEENRRGITEIKHVMGMYELWDGLLQKYPDLIIDNCSSGGRRIDIETLKRSIPFFRSDYQCFFNANAEVLQIHNTNASAYFPYMGCTSKTKNDTYAIRSSYSSSWGGAFYNTIFQSMNEDDFKWAKQITDEYRKIRKYFSMDFYNHGSNKFDSTAWTIWQYHDSETQSGIVMAFRRENSPFDNVEIQLKSTVENQEYLFNDLNTGNTFIGSNAIKIHLPQKQSSVIMEYKLK